MIADHSGRLNVDFQSRCIKLGRIRCAEAATVAWPVVGHYDWVNMACGHVILYMKRHYTGNLYNHE